MKRLPKICANCKFYDPASDSPIKNCGYKFHNTGAMVVALGQLVQRNSCFAWKEQKRE